MGACALFVLLTGLAMLVYPGGTALDDESVGYHFLLNFFSDLGRVHARNGAANPLASALFKGALSAAGAALAIFHIGLARLLWRAAPRRSVGADCARVLGAVGGALAGVCFVGVAFETADVQPHWHAFSVVWAFRFFLLAALSLSFATLKTPAHPRTSVRVAGVFTALLFGYLVLIWRGPAPATHSGLIVQATAQKIIVYAALASVGFQAWTARRWLRLQSRLQLQSRSRLQS